MLSKTSHRIYKIVTYVIESIRPFFENAGRLLMVSSFVWRRRTEMITNAINEVDEVNGGFVLLAPGLAAAFQVGSLGGHRIA
jgi:hypothetical protein